ncbi:hypothetical protein [Halosegnis marinus]|uniref:DUF2909 domain-containing protein n=1 Tax=Halosegnis marinus TaxID=3034023 RepID=A0ABD5ZNM5_9EURY|nr:hypothetical protein [Halosegnis sp. DT85]
MDTRTLLAAVLGVGLGLVCLAAPGAVLRVQFAGRLPDRGGEYGTDGDGSDRLRLLVRVVGAALVLAGGYFAASGAGLV